MVSVSAAQARIDARVRAAAAERERHEREARERVLTTLRSTLPAGARAWLIGSLAWGGFGHRSDVDVVVSGLRPMDEAALETALAGAAGVPVDLLRLETLAPGFRERVMREGVLVDGP
jgi:predicted nucleotidyltransferase